MLKPWLLLTIVATVHGSLPTDRPSILAHRGASGMYPEHTITAYQQAAAQGSDAVECDLTLSKDLVLICSHNPYIEGISNVNSDKGPAHEDFSDRKATYNLDEDDDDDDGNHTGFFAWDFTMEELRTLRRKQGEPITRDSRYDWVDTFITFEEYLQMSIDLEFAVVPEMKNPAATNRVLQDRGETITMEELVAIKFTEYGYSQASDDCLVQTFELSAAINFLDGDNNCRIVLLRYSKYDDSDLDYYASLGIFAIGISKIKIVEISVIGRHISNVNQDLVDKIHERGMQIAIYTFRNEFETLPFDYGQDPYQEMEHFLQIGVEMNFTDFPGSMYRFFVGKGLIT